MNRIMFCSFLFVVAACGQGRSGSEISAVDRYHVLDGKVFEGDPYNIKWTFENGMVTTKYGPRDRRPAKHKYSVEIVTQMFYLGDRVEGYHISHQLNSIDYKFRGEAVQLICTNCDQY